MNYRLDRAATSPVLKIQVSEANIVQACKRNSSHCMIADAVREAIPAATHISVDLQSIRWTDPESGKRYIYLTPRSAQVALLDFDQGRVFPPFSFRLRGAQVLRRGIHRKATIRKVRGNTVDTVDGEAPPLGPLVGGSTKSGKDTVQGDRRTGKRRAFGLKNMTE